MKNDLRQRLHLEPRKGWLNDPNGLCFFKGEYHVYFQYSPQSPLGSGDKCWGHFASPDLLDWRFTGTVLRPDFKDDRSGVYSGCAFVNENYKTLFLFYTGNVKEEGDHDYITAGRGANVILVTTTDGENMGIKRTLLKNSDYPDFCSCHVRDPKVWEEKFGYRMVLGARTLDNKGCVLMYRSHDLANWQYEKTVSRENFGYMWECPDVIDIGGRRFLSISPQGLEHGECEHQNIYSAGYFCFDNDEISGGFEEWDYGFDFYAPQSFKAPDGRKLLIGWFGIGDIPYRNPTVSLGWQHCLTFPRELSLGAKGKIIQRPVRELDRLKGEASAFEEGESIKAQLPFYLSAKTAGEGFGLDFEDMLELRYEGGIFSLRFINETVGAGRDIRRVRLEGPESVEIIADNTSLEIYLNGGGKVMSTRFYPEDTEVRLKAKGIRGSICPLNKMGVSYDG